MSDLLVVCPTRGRPHNIARLIDAWAYTATPTLGAQLLVAVDDDDPAKTDYLEVVHDVGFAWLEAGPRPDPLGMGPILNRHAVQYAASYRAIGFLGDDHAPRTLGWDLNVMLALDAMGTGIVYGNDLLQGANLPTAVFMTTDIIRALGWMVPPGLTHLYIDNAWRDLGQAAACLQYLPDVVIEHVHPFARDTSHRPKAELDDGYRRVNAPEMYAADEAAYRAWHGSGAFARDVQALISLRGGVHGRVS